MSAAITDYRAVQGLRIDHPDFQFIGERATNGFPYVVFERRTYYQPTKEQIADYRDRKSKVERLGGRMILQEYEIAGSTPKYTTVDVDEFRRLTAQALPQGWIVFDSWNGVGSRSLSLGIKPVDTAISTTERVR